MPGPKISKDPAGGRPPRRLRVPLPLQRAGRGRPARPLGRRLRARPREGHGRLRRGQAARQRDRAPAGAHVGLERAGASTIWVQTKKAARRSPFEQRTSQAWVRRPRCRGAPDGHEHVAGHRRREHVGLELDGREVVARRGGFGGCPRRRRCRRTPPRRRRARSRRGGDGARPPPAGPRPARPRCSRPPRRAGPGSCRRCAPGRARDPRRGGSRGGLYGERAGSGLPRPDFPSGGRLRPSCLRSTR